MTDRFGKVLVFWVATLVAISGLEAMPDYDWDLRRLNEKAPVLRDSLDEEGKALLEGFGKQFKYPFIYAKGKGLNEAQLVALRGIREYFNLERDAKTGELSGRGIVVDREGTKPQTDLAKPASFNGDFLPKVDQLNGFYKAANAEDKKAVEAVYRDLMEHFVDQNYLPGGKGPGWIGNGYKYRSKGKWLLCLAHTLPDELRDLAALSQFYISDGSYLLAAKPHASTDAYLNFYGIAFNALAAMSDSPRKLQLLETVARNLTYTITGQPGAAKGMLIPKDGAVIHHDGHHVSYGAYSFGTLYSLNLKFIKAGFRSENTGECVDRFRRAAVAWAFTTTGAQSPLHMQMRASLPLRKNAEVGVGGKGPGIAVMAARMSEAFTGKPMAYDLEMAYVAISKLGEGHRNLPKEWKSLKLPDRLEGAGLTAVLRGHYPHFTNGVAAHRGDGWMATLRCQHNFWRGGEAYDSPGKPTYFFGFALRGGLMIFSHTAKDGRLPGQVDNGYVLEGWDVRQFPNVTAAQLPLGQMLPKRRPGYFNGVTDLVGDATLREFGFWMGRLPEARKSAFFFDEGIVLATDEVRSKAATPVYTNLIQQAHAEPDRQALIVDGERRAEAGEWSLAGGGGHQLIDGNGNGYYIHRHGETPGLKLRRGMQEQVYRGVSKYVGEGPMPDYKWSWEFLGNLKKFEPTRAFFSKVWFDHGVKPDGDALIYTVLPKTSPERLAEYSGRVESAGEAEVEVKTLESAHTYWHKASGARGVALFAGGAEVGFDVFATANRPGAYLWRQEGDRLELSCSSSRVVKDLESFMVTLDGEWGLAEGSAGKIELVDGRTVVTLPFERCVPMSVVLVSLRWLRGEWW